MNPERDDRRTPYENMAAVTMLLVKAPRTRPELVRLLGVRDETLQRALRALSDEGLIEKAPGSRRPGSRGYAAAVFTWTGGAQ